MGFLWFQKVLKMSVSAEIILGRSPLFLYSLAPLQLYPVPREYKGTAKGVSDRSFYEPNLSTENSFLSSESTVKSTVKKSQETLFF